MARRGAAVNGPLISVEGTARHFHHRTIATAHQRPGMETLALDSLDGTLSLFPPTPPSSSPSPCLDLCSPLTLGAPLPLWPALPDSTTCWEDAEAPSWAASSWTLDGLPDVKPDVSDLLQASLRTELPVLNAESTNFLDDGGALAATVGVENTSAELRVDPRAATTTPAPWLAQWTYCAYCAAGGASPCQGVVPTPSTPGQGYTMPGPGGFLLNQALPPTYLTGIGAPTPTPGPASNPAFPYPQSGALLYLEAGVSSDNAFSTPAPLLEGGGAGVRWSQAPPPPPAAMPSPAPEPQTQGEHNLSKHLRSVGDQQTVANREIVRLPVTYLKQLAFIFKVSEVCGR